MWDWHSRCRSSEAALRGRVSDLEDQVADLLNKLFAQHEAAAERERELIDRYTNLLNPAAARMQAMNTRIVNTPPAAPVASTPVPEPEPEPDAPRPESEIPPQIVYTNTRPTMSMPKLTPYDAGLRPRRVPVQTIQPPIEQREQATMGDVEAMSSKG